MEGLYETIERVKVKVVWQDECYTMDSHVTLHIYRGHVSHDNSIGMSNLFINPHSNIDRL